MKINEITNEVIGSAIEVHKELGPGLLESAYEECLAYELKEKGLDIERQKELPIKYKQVQLDLSYRLDIVVEKNVIVELKSVESLLPIHTAQLLSYLKLSELEVGLLINFNVSQLKKGVKRVVNEYTE
ncbi:MAG: GxxExxY protein [Candidatus Marinimicrobia bacterium]|nr:GxxExxY protein [Candidatus Neomarinimicrobiota bacterium]MCF7830315.1 GxxExxY protein [Candidatus Neomarinimicrobiota bacterium]MCF7882292.1 GxxExxY protein [Candidatus Neomarinimicrobiota bacterium]